MDDGFIKVIDNVDDLLREALDHGDVLTTQRESQMLIEIGGVSINKTPRRDGRFQGYVLKDGTKRYFYGRTRDEVASKIKNYFKEEEAPKRKEKAKKSSPTFGEFTENWLALYKEPNLKPLSLASVRTALKPALGRFGAVPIGEISADDLQAFLLGMTANGKGGRLREICMTNLRQIFKKAHSQGIIKVNPCDAVELKARTPQKRRALSISEQEKFVEAAGTAKFSLLYRLLLTTGLRIGEALALHRSDLDPEKHTVTVDKDVIFVGGERVEQETPKSEAGNRTVPLPENLCKELLDTTGDILFPYTYNAVRLSMARLSKEIGITVTPHILRHTYATRLEEAGIPPKIKQYLLGHSSLRMTQDVYTDTQQEYVDSMSERIRSLF